MKQTIVSLTALLLICAGAQRSIAQQDTAHLDAGYLTLKKEFTQSISIKGADLEKMPVMNLSDAISVWLYGAYTTPGTVQYVVDGNPVVDVNAFSIYDVEEVVLVQHAAALIATAPGQSELVLIRTKRGTGPGGMTVAAQPGLVAEDGSPGTRLFHNYYTGAYRNVGKVSFGVSANYIRDVSPGGAEGGKTVTPVNWQRWRLNGYLDWRPDARNQIGVTMNYTPQQLNGLIDPTASQVYPFGERHGGYQHYITPHLDWQGEWAKGLTNDFQATYLHSNLSTEDLQVSATAPDSFMIQEYASAVKSYHLWIRDHFAYAFKTGGWTIEPALNLSYEHINEAEGQSFYTGTGLLGVLNLNAASTLNVSSSYSDQQRNPFVVVPGVDVSYNRGLDFGGGALITPGETLLGRYGRQVYPYMWATVDLLRVGSKEVDSSLRLYGSVANRALTSYQGYTLLDFSNGVLLPFQNVTSSLLGLSSGSLPIGYNPSPLLPYRTWEAGVRYTTMKDRLEVSYTFEHRISSGLGYLSTGNGWDLVYTEWYSSLHHLDIRLKVVDIAGASWRSGLNVTLLHTTVNDEGSVESENSPVGDVSPNPWSWTGGWVNRIHVKDFSAGVDLLYHFNETIGYGVDLKKLSSVTTPNVCVGYRFHFGREEVLEVFVESRDLIRNSGSDVGDPRRYYTVGGKMTL